MASGELQQLSFFDLLIRRRQRKSQRQPVTRSSAEILQVGTHQVSVQRRAYQRSINLHLLPSGGLKVTAGKSVPRRMIIEFVLSQKDWVENQQERWRQGRRLLLERYPTKKYVDGESFLWLGERKILRLEVSAKARSRVFLREQDLVLQRPSSYSKSLRQEVQRFYRTQGQRVLADLIQEWSERMQLFPKRVSYRSMKTRWGSCSSQGHISLNWRLVVFAQAVAEYVVIHELAHLRHQNHSQRFWQLVERYCPDYQKWQKELRDHHWEVDFLAEKPELEESTEALSRAFDG